MIDINKNFMNRVEDKQNKIIPPKFWKCCGVFTQAALIYQLRLKLDLGFRPDSEVQAQKINSTQWDE